MKKLKVVVLSLLTFVLSFCFVGCSKEESQTPEIQIPENHWVSELSSREELQNVFDNEGVKSEYVEGFEVGIVAEPARVSGKVKIIDGVFVAKFDVQISVDQSSYEVYLCDNVLYVSKTVGENQTKFKMDFVVDESLESLLDKSFNTEDEQMIYYLVSYSFIARTPEYLISLFESELGGAEGQIIRVTKGTKETKTRYNYSLDNETEDAKVYNDLLVVYENNKLIEHKIESYQVYYFDGQRVVGSNLYTYKAYAGDVELPNFDEYNG